MPRDVAKKKILIIIKNSNIENHSVNPGECISYQLESPG